MNNEMSVRVRASLGHFTTKLPYVPRSKDRATFEAYSADARRLCSEFERDLIEEHGFTGHPKADIAYAMAWENGHADGLACVADKFEWLCQLL